MKGAERSMVPSGCRNLATAGFLLALYSLEIYWAFERPPGSTLEIADLLVRTATTVGLMSFTLIRREPHAIDRRPGTLVIVIASLSSFALFEAPAYSPTWVYMLLLLIDALVLTAFVSLGRSFAIFPVRYEIKSSGLYAIVRHPVYALYLLGSVALVALAPTAWNLSVLVLELAALIWRAKLEEDLLAVDECYRQYIRKVKYRFIWGIY